MLTDIDTIRKIAQKSNFAKSKTNNNSYTQKNENF